MTEMAEHLHVQISVMTSPCIFIFDVVSNERYQIDAVSLEEKNGQCIKSKYQNIFYILISLFQELT